MVTTPLVALSLKMYFARERTLAYARALAEIAGTVGPVAEGRVRAAFLPDFLTLPASAQILAGTPVVLGAQDCAPDDRGAYTGEVSSVELAALGVRAVELGHAERRGIFGEDDEMVARKAAAAVRNGMNPLLCVGESERVSPDQAARQCLASVDAVLGGVKPVDPWIAYEPHWAIGAPEPAAADHVADVCSRLREGLFDRYGGATILYGGSAGPGLLTTLKGSVDGLFLGRFGHDPAAFARVVHEAASLASQQTRRPDDPPLQ